MRRKAEFFQEIQGSSTVTYDVYNRSSTVEGRQEQARIDSAQNMQSNVSKRQRDVAAGNYRGLRHVPPCTACGNWEPWGTVQSGALLVAKYIATVLLPMALVLWLVTANRTSGLRVSILWALGIAAVAGGLWLVDAIRPRSIEKQLLQFPKDCLPVPLPDAQSQAAFLHQTVQAQG